MAKKLDDIQKQIDRLTKEAAALVAKERREAVATINALLKQFGLAADDLNFGSASKGKRNRVAAVARQGTRSTARQAGVPRYRDPATGKTWTGNGKPPTWIKSAADRSAFLIDASAPSTTSAAASAGTTTAPSTAKRRPAAKPAVTAQPGVTSRAAVKAAAPAKSPAKTPAKSPAKTPAKAPAKAPAKKTRAAKKTAPVTESVPAEGSAQA